MDFFFGLITICSLKQLKNITFSPCSFIDVTGGAAGTCLFIRMLFFPTGSYHNIVRRKVLQFVYVELCLAYDGKTEADPRPCICNRYLQNNVSNVTLITLPFLVTFLTALVPDIGLLFVALAGNVAASTLRFVRVSVSLSTIEL